MFIQDANSFYIRILHEFIRRDHIQTYKLTNLTYHGRTMVVPKIAKLFQLELTHSDLKKKYIKGGTKKRINIKT